MSEENKTVYELNDRVSAFGVEGVVVSVDYNVQEYYPIRVKFINGQYCSFTIDGRLHLWHLEPSLKLIEKAKRKVKKKKFWILISNNDVKNRRISENYFLYDHSDLVMSLDCQQVEIELEVEE